MGQMDRSNNHLLGNCMDGISLHFCSISFSRPIRSSMMSSKSSVYFCGLEGNDLICSRRCTNVVFFKANLAFTASHFVVADVGCIAFIRSLNIESMLPPSSLVKAAISSKFECNVVSSLGAVAMLQLLLAMAEGLLINGLGGSGSECFMLIYRRWIDSVVVFSQASCPRFPGQFRSIDQPPRIATPDQLHLSH